MDSNPMPWRTIDAAAPIGPAVPATVPGDPAGSVRRPSRSTVVALAATGLVALAAFLLAFAGGSSGTFAVAGGGVLGSLAPGGGSSIPDPLGTSAVGAGSMMVEIVGAIAKPGVYTLPAGSRVSALVDAAGGYGPRVDAARASSVLHLASILKDGDQIRVPSRDDPAATAGGGGSGGGGGGSGGAGGAGGPGTPVDLNSATREQLDALPGVGPVTADKIIASREESPFAAVADLQTRKLVGQKTFDGLKDLVTVR